MAGAMGEGRGETVAATLLCLGYGYVAAALARRLAPQGWRIVGTRRAGGASDIADIIAFDGARASSALADLVAGAAAVLVSIPPHDDGCPALAAMQPAFDARRGWTGYLSTTGVYGDRQGAWAHEDDACAPQNILSVRRVRAEAQYRALAHPAQLFRLPGIYGPGRSALDRLRAGEARRIVKPGLVLSRAHVEDIASACALSIAQPDPGRIYNVCDDEPAPPQDVIAFAAALIGVEPPPEIPFEEAALPPSAARFYLESRRVSNARAKAELGWAPIFPSYREGLRAIAEK
jgi:nucleoside-diphosphate-sugar epimerase